MIYLNGNKPVVDFVGGIIGITKMSFDLSTISSTKGRMSVIIVKLPLPVKSNKPRRKNLPESL